MWLLSSDRTDPHPQLNKDSYRVEEDSEEEFSPSDALVQLLGASWILVIEYGVCEEATGLSGQHLKHKTPSLAMRFKCATDPTPAVSLPSYLDPVVDEAPAVASGPQMGVFLGAGHLDVPHRLPGLIELAVNGVNSRVVRSHCVAHVGGDAMLLQMQQKGNASGGQRLSDPQPPKPWSSISPEHSLTPEHSNLLAFAFKFNAVRD